MSCFFCILFIADIGHSKSQSRQEKEKNRQIRLDRFKIEPIRDGNILVRVPDQNNTSNDTTSAIVDKLDEIMRPFAQTN